VSHCNRDPSIIGCCGGTDETCSCECNACCCPVCGERPSKCECVFDLDDEDPKEVGYP